MDLFNRFLMPDVAKMIAAGNIDGLIKALGHKNEEVVAATALGLGQLHARQAVDPLVTLMVSRETPPKIAQAAGQALRSMLSLQEAQNVVDILQYNNNKNNPTLVADLLGKSNYPSLINEKYSDRRFCEETLRAVAYLRLDMYAFMMAVMWTHGKVETRNNNKFVHLTENLLEEMKDAAYIVLATPQLYLKGKEYNNFADEAHRILCRNAGDAVEYGLAHLYDLQDLVSRQLIRLVNDKQANLTSEQRLSLAEKGIEVALVRFEEDDEVARTKAADAISECLKEIPEGSPLRARCLEQMERVVTSTAGEIAYSIFSALITLGKNPTQEQVLQQMPATSFLTASIFRQTINNGGSLSQSLVENCLACCLDEIFDGQFHPDENKDDSLAADEYFSLLGELGGIVNPDTRVRYWILKREFYKCERDGEAAVPYLVDYLGNSYEYYEHSRYFSFAFSDMAERSLVKIGVAACKPLFDAATDPDSTRDKVRAAINVLANIPNMEGGIALDNLLKRNIYPEDVVIAKDYRSGRPYSSYSWVIRK